MGINRQLPHLSRKLPHLGNAGKGINRQLPHLGDAGMGINRQLPHLETAGIGIHFTQGTRYFQLLEYMRELAERLRGVRVCCGDWKRVCGTSVTIRHGITGIFLDPPYSKESGCNKTLYAQESGTVAHEVSAWAIEIGKESLARVALCGYEGEHQMPADWECVPWKAQGGYGSQGTNIARENSHKERIWFSPHCLKGN